MKESSVSPERWETITPHPFARARLHAAMDSVTEPIWFTSKGHHPVSPDAHGREREEAGGP